MKIRETFSRDIRECVFIFLIVFNIHTIHALKDIKLGVAIPWSGASWDAGPRFAAGVTVAVEAINNDPNLLPGYNISFIWGDSKCEEKAGLEVIVDMYTKQKIPVNAIIGPACSDGCKVGALLASHWNIPIISYGCAGAFLSELKIYPNFARTVGVYSKSGKIFVKLMKQYKWKKIAILTPTSGIWSSIMNGVRADIEGTKGLEVSYFQNFNHESVTDAFLANILKEARKKAHSKFPYLFIYLFLICWFVCLLIPPVRTDIAIDKPMIIEINYLGLQSFTKIMAQTAKFARK